jgi:hypothetical protein
MHHDGVTDDEPAPTTVRDRLTAAGLSDSRIEEHMTAERVRVDGELVTVRPASVTARAHRYHGPVGHSRRSPT